MLPWEMIDDEPAGADSGVLRPVGAKMDSSRTNESVEFEAHSEA